MYSLKHKRTAALKNKIGRENGHLIDLARLVKIYESAAGKFTALNGVDLQVDEGEFLSIIGKSGSGKSTLINMITGIDQPTSGQVLVNGALINSLDEGSIAVWRGSAVGVIFQFFQLLPTLTAVENVMLPMDYWGAYSISERPERAMRLLDLVDMADHAHQMPAALSGGQQQRVAIARALANDPPILAADEPTGNLDTNSAENVLALFESLVDDGKTILMVTHDNDLVERATRTVTLADGMIVDEIDRRK
jgi:putative ABC transport system ATP-binding protein